MPNIHLIKKIYILAIFIIFFLPLVCAAYLLPYSQVIELMEKKLINSPTLIVHQTVSTENNHKSDGMEQDIWIKLPDFYYCKRLPPSSGEKETDQASPAHSRECGTCPPPIFLKLLLQGPESQVTNLLSNWGIATDKLSFVRLNGEIGYRIGDKGLYDPALIINRETYLPVVLRYRATNSTYGLVTIKFEDYQKIDTGWFPFRISCITQEGTMETYIIKHVETNIEIDPQEFPRQEIQPSLSPPPPQEQTEKSPADDRIKEIIESLKRKYQ